MPRVLVVDDEAGVRQSLGMLLQGETEVVLAESADAADAALVDAPPDLVLLDLVMPGRSGLDLLSDWKQRGVTPPVLVLTATKTVTTAVEAMQLGAADYVTKPFEVDALRIKIRNLLAQQELRDQVDALRDELDERSRLGNLVGRSASMRQVFRTIEKMAASKSNVLIQGESGTGKELVARAIHELGPRSATPFVAVNCAAIPESLMESELFGHERGAFTDAHERRIGKFELAAEGTLFLDEIGELPLAVQGTLLRALQEREIERVGGAQAIPVKARFVAATNRQLKHEVEAGRFREDLYYRIAVVPIDLPPLRERREDIALIAQSFLRELQERDGGDTIEISRPGVVALERYSWPGNVRELQNTLERASALCDGSVIDETVLPETVIRASRGEALSDAVRERSMSIDDAVHAFEAELLREALDQTRWNQTRAAERLGTTRRRLKLKMDEYGLSKEDPSD